MPITVHSPYSGRPVKVRDQDVGRAVRDEDGRIFYVVPRSWGEGHYAALTRNGSEKDERRYAELLEKIEQSEEQAELAMAPVRDATGKRRRRAWPWVVLLLVLAAAGGAAYYVFVVNDGAAPWLDDAPEVPEVPDVPVEAPPVPEVSRATPVADVAELRAVAAAADPPRSVAPPRVVERGEFTTLASGLMLRTDRVGVGEPAAAGELVRLRYRDKSFDAPARLDDQPWQAARFVLWSGDAPAGWDEALAGMRVGERRTALIPRVAARGEVRFDVAEFELLETLPGIAAETELTGQGPILRPGNTAVVHYRAFVRGREAAFLDTHAGGEPVRFVLGSGDVIQGLELGVAGMRVGEVRGVTVPPHLAYGERAIGDAVPANSTLVFLVELIGIE